MNKNDIDIPPDDQNILNDCKDALKNDFNITNVSDEEIRRAALDAVRRGLVKKKDAIRELHELAEPYRQ